MKAELYHLAETTVVEPLVNRWPAWSFAVAPGPAGFHLANYQIPAMESYLSNPAAHLQACRDPNLIGGPFVDLPEHRAGEVRTLLEESKRTMRDNLAFAAAFTAFHNKLSAEAKGQSLAPYYLRLPPELRGYVELIYDYYNRASVRLMETLLYESKYYKPELQSFRLVRLRDDESRPFFISTPRLPTEGELDWREPFDSARIESLFKLDTRPQSIADVREILGTDDDGELTAFLTPAVERPNREWDETTPRIRYFGHACVLLQWNGLSILTDPCIGSKTMQGGLDRYSFHDLPDHIDYAIVTHSHQDHFVLETLLRLRHRIGTLVTPRSLGILTGDVSLKTLARKLGFRNVIELDAFEAEAFDGGEIRAVPFLGEHGDLAHGKGAYVIRFGKSSTLFAADSDCLDRSVYEHVYNFMGPIQTVFLGVESVGAPLSWLCGSLFPKKSRSQHENTRRYHGCDAAAAFEILSALKASQLYIYAMGMEPWLVHLLGLNLHEGSPQIEQAKRLLSVARERGSMLAEQLFGKAELFLPAA